MRLKGSSQRPISRSNHAPISPNASLLSPASIEKLINQCCKKKSPDGLNLIQIYNRTWLLDLLSGEKLKRLEVNFKQFDRGGVDIIDFVKLLLHTLDGNGPNLIYYIIAAADLYKDVCEGLSNPNLLKYREFTDYLINVPIKT